MRRQHTVVAAVLPARRITSEQTTTAFRRRRSVLHRPGTGRCDAMAVDRTDCGNLAGNGAEAYAPSRTIANLISRTWASVKARGGDLKHVATFTTGLPEPWWGLWRLP